MSLFGKDKESQKSSIDLIAGPILPVINYDSVLEYMISLSDRDFAKLHDIANIYREANAKANKILGVKNEATIALKDELQTIAPILIKPDDDDFDAELKAAFLEDDPPSSKPRKVEVS